MGGEWHGTEPKPIVRDGVHWDAQTHQQLWDWFAQPKLVEMRAWAEAFSTKVGGHFQEAADQVNEALRVAGVHWEGSAADSMRDASSPLAQHALVAKDAAVTVGQTAADQLDAAAQIARALPEPKPVPQQADLLSAGESPTMMQYLTDIYPQEQAASEAQERARDLARDYDAGADEAVGGLPTFEKAPPATVARAEPGATIEVPDPRPGPGSGPDSGPDGGPGSGPGYTGSGPSTGAQSAPPSGPTGPGGTSGQSWTPQPNTGLGDTARPTGTTPLTSGFTGGPGLVPGAGPGGGPGAAGPGARSGNPGSAGQPGRPGPGERLGTGRAAPPEGIATRGPQPNTRGASGMTPMGAAGRGKNEEDAERNSPDYLRDYNDEFWDDTPPVAPAVIGDDDDEDE